MLGVKYCLNLLPRLRSPVYKLACNAPEPARMAHKWLCERNPWAVIESQDVARTRLPVGSARCGHTQRPAGIQSARAAATTVCCPTPALHLGIAPCAPPHHAAIEQLIRAPHQQDRPVNGRLSGMPLAAWDESLSLTDDETDQYGVTGGVASISRCRATISCQYAVTSAASNSVAICQNTQAYCV